ncbi:hypothetical protein AMTR_s00012p00219270 [Amborella trichopoda]|uniref:Uncharacterized protein n=1 Tax=Amborella trichopoda TaxID=13333 RepID=W1PL63_AMBTC|nr:hypothetical protein AMTR_s00012p00219270 [Amborella trichopoda]
MTTRRVARTSGGPRMKNTMGNDTVEDVIVIVDDEPPVAMLERLISTLNPSVNPLLDFYLDQPPIFGYAKGLLEQLKSDLTYQEGCHPTLEVHSLKEGEYAALGGISFRDNEAGMLVLQHHIAEMKALLSQVSEEMCDLPPTNFESGPSLY